jgi:GNAT superfamily N-acetyltransferase
MSFAVREATSADIPILQTLIADSARRLSQADYTEEQVEAALRGTMGVDTVLIRDRTYFVAEAEGEIVGCGGWSRRRALFGSDNRPGREPGLLDPACEAAKIRAFFVRPDWARRGVGGRLLSHCEAEAHANGFSAVELMATLPGRRLYQARGYFGGEPIQYPVGDGLTMELVPMRKELEKSVGDLSLSRARARCPV